MNSAATIKPFVAIACGGTGGHLFPGLAVAGQLKQRGCDVMLLISPKDVDQQAVKSAQGMDVVTLPAVGLQNRNYLSFAGSFFKSLSAARKIFRQRKPVAVLAMGGFTSAPPVLAGKWAGAKTFLHESNTIPGKANRLLARVVDVAFIGFSEAAGRLRTRKALRTGTPVRPQFHPRDAGVCRRALGLDPSRPTILVVGGSQGASGLNSLILSALPLLKDRGWQWLHLTGANDFERVKTGYAAQDIKVMAKPFLAEMDLALGAATIAVSRGGASSLAEMAAMRRPSLLVPLPTAADNHQFFNVTAVVETGAARLLDQKNSSPEKVAGMLVELVENEVEQGAMRSALAQWHAPQSAELIANVMLSIVGQGVANRVRADVPGGAGGEIKLKAIA